MSDLDTPDCANLMSLLVRILTTARSGRAQCFAVNHQREKTNVSQTVHYEILAVRNRNALAITDTDERLIAAAASMGDNRIPING